MIARYSLFRTSILFLSSCVVSSPVFADSLNLQGNSLAPCPSVTISSGSATLTCPPTGTTALTITSTSMGNLSTGAFGDLSFVSDIGGTGLGSGASVTSFFQVTYMFTISGVSNGTAQFDITADGSLVPNNGNAAAEFEETGEQYTINGAPGPVGGTPLGSGSSHIVITTPITNGVTELEFALDVVASCSGTQACTSTADFLDPTSITGASAFDANGNLVTGASFVSESGFNPNAPNTVPTPTPEPSGLLLLGTGLLAFIGAARLKAFTGVSRV